MGQASPASSRSAVTIVLSHAVALTVIFIAAMWLRLVKVQMDPDLQGYLQVITGLLAFVFGAVTLVRFRGTQDRISLILGAGFLLSGTVLIASSVFFFQFLQDKPKLFISAPVVLWVGRMILAVLLVVALLVEHFLPRSRHPRGEIAGALLTVVGFTYLITAAVHKLPQEVSSRPISLIPSPQQLLPGAIFLIGLVWYRRRLGSDSSAFDRSIYVATWFNFSAQLVISQSQQFMDAPFVLSQGLVVISYTVALGGALLDNARLFEQVRHLAVSDPLTGLANYRRLLDVLENETERTNRTGRPFAVLLLDLDGLKKINDTFGHLVGSRAICRLADILRIHCRSIDTAARYGGDEFALVLPETQEVEAKLVAERIRDVMVIEQEKPPLSASIGIAIYRGDGERIEKLLSAADEHLYAEKAKRSKKMAAAVGAARRKAARPGPIQ